MKKSDILIQFNDLLAYYMSSKEVEFFRRRVSYESYLGEYMTLYEKYIKITTVENLLDYYKELVNYPIKPIKKINLIGQYLKTKPTDLLLMECLHNLEN